MLKLNTKLLAVLFSVLLVADLHATEPKVIYSPVTTSVKTVCLGGLWFAVATSSKGHVSIVQMFEQVGGYNSTPKPIKCKSN